MNRRLAISSILIAVFPSSLYGGQVFLFDSSLSSPLNLVAISVASGVQEASPEGSGTPAKQTLMHLIETYEAALRKAQSTHAGGREQGRIYSQLGLLYENAALWERAEDALESAVSLFRQLPEANDDLAAALGELGGLHVSMGKFGLSEKEQLETLRLRENLKEPLEVARSQYELAALYLAQNKFAKAKDSAERALTEFVANGQATPFDRISVRYALSLALCGYKDWTAAISALKAGLDEAKTSSQPNVFSIGLGEFLLGFAYWRSGDAADAGDLMARGTNLMSAQLGWGHPSYVKALQFYAQFLHENHRTEEADVVSRKVRKIQEIVDVRSLQQGSLGLSGLR